MAPESTRRAAFTVTLLCWSLVVFDGYDLIVYGTVLPSLLAEPGWGLDPAGAGAIGSVTFAGMLVGALAAGSLSDRLGRRRAIVGCTIVFSLATGLCATAGDPLAFGLLRFVAGIGLGGLVPAANALGAEFVRPRNRPMVATVMMSGIPVGGSLAALVGTVVLPAGGWRPMFLPALLGVVVLLPACLVWLPESPSWLRSRGRDADAELVERRFGVVGEPPAPRATAGSERFRTLFRAPYLVPTALLSLATAATLFTWYGLGTWLPQLMATAGFALGPALGFLLALNLGAVAGSLVVAAAAARIGAGRAGVVGCALAATGLLVLTTGPGTAVSYAALLLAGVGTHGTQCLIIAIVAARYPPAVRGSALGVALGVGRIGAVAAPQAGGLLLAAGYGVRAEFVLFATAAAVAALVLLMVTAVVRSDAPKGVPA